jgi:hypothetical protein
MKKIIAFALLAMMMVGCEEKNENREYATCERGYTYEVLVIDSCEYFRSAYILAHKGNCRFCSERNKRMFREQVDSILTDIFD